MHTNYTNIRRIKIILTGGGTRGMYQIGVMQALKEAGYLEDVVSYSACSIGAVNAVFLSQYSIDECKKLWEDFTTKPMFENVDQYADTYLLQVAKESLTKDGLNLNPFRKLFEEYIDEKIVRQTDKELILTAYNVTKNKQEYHNLKNIPEGELIEYVMASARLPFFKPVFINGDKYADGGVGDNQPYYSELENKHFDLVIKIRVMYVPFWIPGISQSNITFDKEIEIKPSKRIGTPIEFKKPSFSEKYALGFADAVSALKAAINN